MAATLPPLSPPEDEEVGFGAGFPPPPLYC